MSKDIHIIASCTDRKREEVPEGLRLRTVPAGDAEERASMWWERLVGNGHPTTPAGRFYAGDHWRVIQELPELAVQVGLRPRLWVASAGYGLIPAEAPVRPYSATFARSQPDSVASGAGARNTAEVLRRWWDSLSRRGVPDVHAPRSIQGLAREWPGATLLIVASPLYVEAMKDDLLSALKSLASLESLIVVSSASALSRGALAANWVPSTAHLQARYGGSRLSLHARVARNIVLESPDQGLSAGKLRGHYQRLIRRSDAPVRHDRTTMSDDQVRKFIQDHRSTSPAKSCTASLKLLRASGFACEQHRFKQLYSSLKGAS